MNKTKAPEDRFLSAAGRQLAVYGAIAVAVLVALMFLLSWLASLTSSGSVSRGAVDVENNAITIYLRDEPPQLSSIRSTDGVSSVVLGHVMEGLLRYDEYQQLAPGMAERWEIEGDTATFWIRDNARWSNGDPVTAHDFVFAWQSVVNPVSGSQYAFILFPIRNAEAITNGELPPDQLGVTALDDKTLQVTLETPIAYFDRMIAFVTYLPVQQDFYENTAGRFGADADELLYNGPFMLTSWVHGSTMRMEKNPYYWDVDRVKLDAIHVGYMTSDTNTLLNLFKDQQIVMTNLEGAEVLEEAMLQGWQIERFMDGSVFFTEFNHRPGRITTNLNLRKALHYAQDANELVNRVIKLPGYLPAESLFPVWLEGIEGRLRDENPAPLHERNVEQAREYLQLALDELGLDRLPPLVLLADVTPVSRLQAEYYQEVFRRSLGIEIIIDSQIFRQRLEKMTAGDFDLVVTGWSPDYNDPLTFGDYYASWNLNNRSRYQNPELDEQIRITQNSIDTQERMNAFGEIQRILLEDHAHMPNYERGIVYVTHPQVKGIVRRVFGPEADYSYAYIEADE